MKAIIFSAHSDDFVIGAGGYIAQHPKQTHCVVFSMGEMSHPWLKPEEIKKFVGTKRIRQQKFYGRVLHPTI